jgi:hypothetical protein
VGRPELSSAQISIRNPDANRRQRITLIGVRKNRKIDMSTQTMKHYALLLVLAIPLMLVPHSFAPFANEWDHCGVGAHVTVKHKYFL